MLRMPAPAFPPTAHASPILSVSLHAFGDDVVDTFLPLPWDAADACPLFPIYSPYTALTLGPAGFQGLPNQPKVQASELVWQ